MLLIVNICFFLFWLSLCFFCVLGAHCHDIAPRLLEFWGLTINVIFWVIQFSHFLLQMLPLPQAALAFARQNSWETQPVQSKRISHRNLVTLIIFPVHFMLMSLWLMQWEIQCVSWNIIFNSESYLKGSYLIESF